MVVVTLPLCKVWWYHKEGILLDDSMMILLLPFGINNNLPPKIFHSSFIVTLKTAAHNIYRAVCISDLTVNISQIYITLDFPSLWDFPTEFHTLMRAVEASCGGGRSPQLSHQSTCGTIPYSVLHYGNLGLVRHCGISTQFNTAPRELHARPFTTLLNER